MKPVSRPLFYQPVFGNDNGFVNFDAVDVAAFAAPALRQKDVATKDVATPDQPARTPRKPVSK